MSVYAGYVSRLELLDEVQVKAINITNGKNFPECPTLMFEFIGTGGYMCVCVCVVHMNHEIGENLCQ